MDTQFPAKCSSVIALQVHTYKEMIRFAPGCFWSPYSRPTFLSIFPWSPLGKISENGRFRSPWQICHKSALRALMEAQFAAKCSSVIALQVHTNWEMMWFAPGCFWSPYSWPTFLSIFPWSPLGKISENGRFRSPWQICHNSALRALMEAQFAAKCSSVIALQVHTNWEMMWFASGCFWSPYSRPTFLSIFPWSLLGKISENGRFRSLWQICHNSALRALMEAQFAAKCSSMIALQVHTNWEMMWFASGCFWSPYSRPTFLSIFPWSLLGKISENGRFRSLWQICHNSALRALMEAQFAAKCSSMIALQVHTN